MQSARNKWPNCAALDLHPLRAVDEEAYELVVVIRFGWQDFLEDGLEFQVGVRESVLRLEFGNCAIVPGTRFADEQKSISYERATKISEDTHQSVSKQFLRVQA